MDLGMQKNIGQLKLRAERAECSSQNRGIYIIMKKTKRLNKKIKNKKSQELEEKNLWWWLKGHAPEVVLGVDLGNLRDIWRKQQAHHYQSCHMCVNEFSLSPIMYVSNAYKCDTMCLSKVDLSVSWCAKRTLNGKKKVSKASK